MGGADACGPQRGYGPGLRPARTGLGPGHRTRDRRHQGARLSAQSVVSGARPRWGAWRRSARCTTICVTRGMIPRHLSAPVLGDQPGAAGRPRAHRPVGRDRPGMAASRRTMAGCGRRDALTLSRPTNPRPAEGPPGQHRGRSSDETCLSIFWFWGEQHVLRTQKCSGLPR